jgi:hypothetical protein
MTSLPILLLASLTFVSSQAAFAGETCHSIDPPQPWSAQEQTAPVTVRIDHAATAALDLVVFRHAEKPMRDDGVMIEDGNLGREAEYRLSRLPDRLLKEFGCPDLLVAPNPAVKMINKKSGQFYNYIRPLATIEPISLRLNFPVWTPYGYNQSHFLAQDLLDEVATRSKTSEKPRTVYIAWERQNIPKLYRELVVRGKLRDLARTVATIDGLPVHCDEPQTWEQCDFDSIWFIRVRNIGVCLSRRTENLNTVSYQEKCKGAESVADAPK